MSTTHHRLLCSFVLGCLCLFARGANSQAIVLDKPDAETGDRMVVESAGECVETSQDGSYRHNSGAAPAEKLIARFSFMPPKDGCYAVEEFHPVLTDKCARGGKVSDKVPLRIDFCKGKVAMGVVDQSKRGGKWNMLTRLPFFVGHKGSISITREGFPQAVCPDNACFYVADAFRFTYLAPTCDQTERPQTSRATAEEDVKAEEAQEKDVATGKNTGSPSTTSAASVSAEMHAGVMTLQVTADDHVQGKFLFQPPRTGCWMVEERHPHVDGKSAVPLSLNYCKGKTKQLAVKHDDGRHLQWNYVANLPFFEDFEASAVMPHEQVRGEHAFRFTHLPGSCRAESSHVYRTELRLTTDFANVANRLHEFKQDLGAALARHTGVSAERLTVTHARAGSVIAEITVRPAGSEVDVGTAASRLSAQEIMTKLQEIIASGTATKELCEMAGAAEGSSCTAEILQTGIARPLSSTSTPESRSSGNTVPEEDGISAGAAAGISVVALVFCASTGGVIFLKMNKGKQRQAEVAKQECMEHEDTNVIVVTPAATDAQKTKPDGDEKGIDDNASTITPTSDRSKLEDVELN